MNPEFLDKKNNPCKSFEQNLIIDTYGNVKFCFNDIPSPLHKIGNIRKSSIDELWCGEIVRNIKRKMEGCDRACGITACHINANLRID